MNPPFYLCVNVIVQYAILLSEVRRRMFRRAPLALIKGRQETTGYDRRRQVQKAEFHLFRTSIPVGKNVGLANKLMLIACF